MQILEFCKLFANLNRFSVKIICVNNFWDQENSIVYRRPSIN